MEIREEGHRSANFLLQSVGRGGRDFSQIAFYCHVRTGARSLLPSVTSLSPSSSRHPYSRSGMVSHLPPGKLRSGPLRRKSNFRSLSPSHHHQLCIRCRRSPRGPTLLICGPRRCGYDTRLLPPSWPSFGASLPFLSLLPRALPPSVRPRLIKY